jgi:CysZ protein
VGALAAAVGSFALPLEALGLLVRERRLWGPAGLPLALSLVAVAAAVATVTSFSGEIQAYAASLLPTLEAGAWYSWLWIGPARAALWLAVRLLFLLAAAVAVLVAFLLASLVAAPFHDVLARRVEEMETGRVVESEAEGLGDVLREAARAVLEEARRLLFFVGVSAFLLALFWFVPGGQLVAPPAMTLFAVFFLPLEYASYTLDRRRLSFREKRGWLTRNAPASLGYGGAAFALCAVPLLNLFAMPVLVVAGTLLAVRNR